ncbi:unnamed protein product [Absidia cylindrospora]
MHNNSSPSDDEEDDYMSGAFLEQASQYEKKNKQKTYSERRREQLREQQKKAYIKPRRELEQEAREEGLQKQLTGDNKGMKMMMKMGFKQGSGLGKDGQTGRQEPIAVELKQNRGGIGIDTLQKRKLAQEEHEALEKRKKLDMDPLLYREQMAEKAKEGKRLRQMTAAVHICQKKDEEKEIEHNILWTLLPKRYEDNDDDETEDDKQEEKEEESQEKVDLPYTEEQVDELKSLPLDEQLGQLVDYLRSHYDYCFWCGAQYDSEEDLNTNCPGLTEDDH